MRMADDEIAHILNIFNILLQLDSHASCIMRSADMLDTGNRIEQRRRRRRRTN